MNPLLCSRDAAVGGTRPIRVCYIDTCLRSNVGHYANSARHIAGELRRRNVAVEVYGNRVMASSLAEELGATAFFRHIGSEPVFAYVLRRVLLPLDYRIACDNFVRELRSLWRRGPYDLVYVNSILPAELAGIAKWLDGFPDGAAPAVVVEFGTPSGNNVEDGYMGGYWRQFTNLYRHAGTLLHRQGSNFFPFTFDAASSAEYAELLGRPVATMPVVHAGAQNPRLRKRGSDGNVTVTFLGHQRAEKGYHLVPEIVRRLRSSAVPVNILVHNGGPEEASLNLELRAMAATDTRLIFDDRPADAVYWQNLLDRSDVVVLPYEPTRYRASYSAVAVEAVGQGIPLVVPDGTTMETLARTYQQSAVAFAGWTAAEVSNAIEMSVLNFENLAKAALAGAEEWRRTNGQGRFADRLLEIVSTHRRQVPMDDSGHAVGDAVMGLIYGPLFSAADTIGHMPRRLRRLYTNIRGNRGGMGVSTANFV